MGALSGISARDATVGRALAVTGRLSRNWLDSESQAPLNAAMAPLKGPIMRIISNLALIAGAWLALACPWESQAWPLGPKGNDAPEKKANIRQQRDEMLSQLAALNPEVKASISRAVGYATFKQVNIHLTLLSTANGYGMVVDNKSGQETFMRMASLGGGVGMGVRDVRVIFVFHDPALMRQFIEQGVQFGGQADTSAKYQNLGVSGDQSLKANLNYKDGTVASGSATDLSLKAGSQGSADAKLASRGGMEIYQFTDSGVSLQATVSGTKYWKDSKLNP
jgi:hypothetical protein